MVTLLKTTTRKTNTTNVTSSTGVLGDARLILRGTPRDRVVTTENRAAHAIAPNTPTNSTEVLGDDRLHGRGSPRDQLVTDEINLCPASSFDLVPAFFLTIGFFLRLTGYDLFENSLALSAHPGGRPSSAFFTCSFASSLNGGDDYFSSA
jgi:hypothetical protein